MLGPVMPKGVGTFRRTCSPSSNDLDLPHRPCLKWDWSHAEASKYTTPIINPIIDGEVSIGCSTIEALDAVLPATL
jgi:hypothetical protein